MRERTKKINYTIYMLIIIWEIRDKNSITSFKIACKNDAKENIEIQANFVIKKKS